MTDLIERYRQEYVRATDDLKKIGVPIGWMRDTDDYDDIEELFEPLLAKMNGGMSDTEQYKMEKNLDAYKSCEFLAAYDKWEKAKKKLDILNENMTRNEE